MDATDSPRNDADASAHAQAVPKPQFNVWTGQDDTIQNARLMFAQTNLENAQNLVRFIDQKAAFILTAVGVLTAALFTLLVESANAPVATVAGSIVRSLLAITVLVYAFISSLVVYAGARIYTPAKAELRPDTDAPGLIFPLTLLKRYEADEDRYRHKLLGVSYEDMLHDYANQMMEVSWIYQAKHHFLNTAVMRFRWLCVGWICAIFLGVAVVLRVM